ncbi:MAG: hypothetical protein KIS61_31620 [Candidatus Eremiobacteraeota bacterium]|nr:hypothetical protein [Candidatus Eremiobacteraeota bacterium]
MQIPLLCALCEARFNEWETKIAPIYLRWMAAKDAREVCLGVVTDLRLHWKSFRALLLSIFWRISAAYIHEYRNLQLPPDDQESLRKVLLSEPDPSLTVWNISAIVMTPWDESRGLVSNRHHHLGAVGALLALSWCGVVPAFARERLD